MSKPFNRRNFLLAGAGLAAAAVPTALLGEVSGSSGAQSPAGGKAPAVAAPRGVKPLVISSANGNVHKNGGEVTAVQKAFAMMAQGSDVLDALLAGVNILELDPEEDSVGYGGLPNADGVVQLDSSCMHGPLRRAGGVACAPRR